jgi:hypothetical protein
MVRSGLGDSLSSTADDDVMLFTVPKYKGLDSDREDEYEKYNEMWDGFADQQLINSGATIISSTIEISDSSGNNRIIVRRDSD